MGQPRLGADREGRLVGVRVLRLLPLAAVVLATLGIGAATAGAFPWEQRVQAAERFADSRAGRISFAVVDESGRLHGAHVDRVHNSASVVKVLFMVTLLRQPDVRSDDLTGTERRQLRAMI